MIYRNQGNLYAQFWDVDRRSRIGGHRTYILAGVSGFKHKLTTCAIRSDRNGVRMYGHIGYL